MKKILSHIDFTRVGHAQSILEANGIQTLVKNKGASTGMGEIPFTEIWPELWIVDDADFLEATKAIEDVTSAPTPIEPWTCNRCGEEVGENFSECWNCSATRDDSQKGNVFQ